MTQQPYIPSYRFPKQKTKPVEAIIHPARGTSNIRYGNGVGHDIVRTIDDGSVVFVYPENVEFDLMKKYPWIWVEPKDDPDHCGWVSLLIPFEQMFEEVEQSGTK
jgi:hypothetical protein